jgi:DNA-directed RNA polymerase subunit K/omega
VVEEHQIPDIQSEEASAPVEPFERVTPPESRFLFVDVAALRAKQLRRGARSRLDSLADGGPEPGAAHPQKPERIAMEEVRRGLVSFEIVDPKAEPPGGGQ